MEQNASARLLWAGVGGILVAGLLRVVLSDTLDLGRATILALALVVASLVVYRALERRGR